MKISIKHQNRYANRFCENYLKYYKGGRYERELYTRH